MTFSFPDPFDFSTWTADGTVTGNGVDPLGSVVVDAADAPELGGVPLDLFGVTDLTVSFSIGNGPCSGSIAGGCLFWQGTGEDALFPGDIWQFTVLTPVLPVFMAVDDTTFGGLDPNGLWQAEMLWFQNVNFEQVEGNARNLALVPEPATLSLVGLGALGGGLGWFRRRRSAR